MDQEKLVLYPTNMDKMDCRLRFHWSRKYRTPKSAALVFGIVIHEALQGYYELGMDPVDAMDEYIGEDPEGVIDEGFDYNLAKAMLQNYVKEYKGERFQTLATELEIARRIPIPHDEDDPPERANRFYVGARVDLIVLDESKGQIFAMDHKTFSRFYADSIQRNHQFMISAYVAEGWLRKPVAGFLYNGLRKKAEPTKSTNLFERVPVYVNDRMIETMLHRAYWTLKEASADYYPVYPEPSSLKCTYCRFKQPCTEYMRGGDYKFMLDNTMQRREGSDDTYWASDHFDEGD